MADEVSLPEPLVGKTMENVDDVWADLVALRDKLNGEIRAGNLHDEAVTVSKLATDVRSLFSPVGSVVMTARAAADTGWLLCDGAAVSRSGYPALFEAIGTNFGVGDGSSSFNLPDFRGRASVGVGTAAEPVPVGATAHTVGQKGGAEAHVLTSAQSGMPAHAHSASAGNDTPDHSHNITYQIASYMASVQGSGGVSVQAGATDYSGGWSGGASARHSHGITVNNSAAPNAAQAHENMPPFQAINFQIKT